MVSTSVNSISEGFLFARLLASGADGACLFESVRKLIREDLDVQTYRNICSEKIKQIYLPTDIINGEPRDEYCERIKEKGYCGGAVDLRALSLHFQIDFHVIIMQNGKITGPPVPFGDNPSNFAYLLYDSDNSHYYSVILFTADMSTRQERFSRSHSEFIKNLLQTTFLNKIDSTNALNDAIQNNLYAYDPYPIEYLSSYIPSAAPQTDSALNELIKLAVSPIDVNTSTDERQRILEAKLCSLYEILGHGNLVANYTNPTDERKFSDLMEEQLLACTEHIVIQPAEVHTTLSLQTTEPHATTSAIGTVQMPDPVIIDQPNRYQRIRYIGELGLEGSTDTGSFQCVQSGPHERGYPATAITPEMEGLYMEVALYTHNEKPHPFPLIPEDCKRDGEDNLVIHENPNVKANLTAQLLHYPITAKDCLDKCKRYAMKIPKLKFRKPLLTKKMMKDEKLKLAKLKFTICKELNGNFTPMSTPSFSNLMEFVLVALPTMSTKVSTNGLASALW
ncbi:unnamed protein product [Didymodactylos carnosus]|uniref:OTU domain-containing protein n=1 Tax=Didymodactylos carnosus TaxID=1234261 RepID=A0A8S2HW03_9BILA|nr:unnamed protein product [Didymodactylos carnosus]CAF3691187.1 unnamed protein product [Didymodactylos carnosus]